MPEISRFARVVRFTDTADHPPNFLDSTDTNVRLF
jgi:hypothetical protein